MITKNINENFIITVSTFNTLFNIDDWIASYAPMSDLNHKTTIGNLQESIIDGHNSGEYTTDNFSIDKADDYLLTVISDTHNINLKKRLNIVDKRIKLDYSMAIEDTLLEDTNIDMVELPDIELPDIKLEDI